MEEEEESSSTEESFKAISGEFRVYKRIKRVKFECEKPGKKSADNNENGRG